LEALNKRERKATVIGMNNGGRFNKLNKDVDKIEEIELKKKNQHSGLQIDKTLLLCQIAVGIFMENSL
jgi:hypothetical protein